MSSLKNMLVRMKSKEGDDGVGSADGGGNDAAGSSTSQPPKKQTIESTYQKKSQLEHILLRPDTYIGSVEPVTEAMWIYDKEGNQMIMKTIEYVPGLYKIFDEILVNAADNKQRDKSMNCIKIIIDAENNIISVWNNGFGIPVAMHKDEKMYVPTMIFGHLLTSSNYNDEEQKVTGGRNGYGAKLCNIFSKKFTLETASNQYKKQFKQTWANNMSKASEAMVKEFSGADFTKVTFSPDLAKFKMEKLDDDIIGLMSRRAYDVAASSKGVKVFLNGERLPINNFKDYVGLFIKNKEDETGNVPKVLYENVSDRWEVAMTLSDKGFQQMSFVNSIATTKGGRHVDYVTDMIVKQVIEVLKKKNKGGVNIKPFQVKNHLWMFVNCLIVNPTFDSQTKENMTLQSKNFGSKCNLSDIFISAVIKSGIVESVLTWAKFKAETELSKTGGKKYAKLKGIPKLEDANEAGTKNALKCTLILTEGDSAKSLAVSGLGVIGRDYYGVFPLRGKLLNVREATHKQILENIEINNLIKILGLQYKKKYNTIDDMKTLRYGKVMIMTDQDQDGSHIKGLLINFVHCNWPELLKRDFLEEFITPIVKATKRNEELSFYSLPEFEEWKSNTANHSTYHVKYYKGLGTSTSKEAKEYFTNMERHRIKFRYAGQTDDDHILLAFSKKQIENRKEWLTKFMLESKRLKQLGLPEKYLYAKDTRYISYSDFVNLELVLFSNADNVRSIPSMVDGMKPGQRKVLFTCIKRNDKREVKVAQLAGSVAEHSAYHHGEQSLCGTIVHLAQNFVGSNNINLLEPRGQFGTRLTGGKDSASPRYIFTKMSPLTRLIVHPADDAILKHEYDDNLRIEPEWYAPIIPMILVNGAEGIGTGWMTKIPNYNPRELIQNIRLMLENEEPVTMLPWYKNFQGVIEEYNESRYVVSGEVSVLNGDRLEITELPVGTWTQVYKENVIEPFLNGAEKVKPILSDYKEYNTDTTIRFLLNFLPGEFAIAEKEGFHKVLKLQTTIITTSMCVFDEMGCLRKFDSVSDILKEYYTLRLKMYQKRKEHLEGLLEAEASKLSHQARFIIEKCKGDLVVENKKRKIIVDELIKRGYPPDPIKEWKEKLGNAEDDAAQDEPNEDENSDEDENEERAEATKNRAKQANATNSESADVKKFDYLLGMSMWMLTEEKKNELLRQRDQKLTELQILKKKTDKDLWKEDLEELLVKLDVVEAKERADDNLDTKVKGKKPKGKKNIDRLETMPSPAAKRITPIINVDLKKKMEQATKAKEKRLLPKKDMNVKDEFDELIDGATLKTRVRKAVDKDTTGLKQTKLNFETAKKTAPREKVSGRPNKNDTQETADSSDSESKLKQKSQTRPRPRRALAVRKVYIVDDSSDDDHDNKVVNKRTDTSVNGDSSQNEEISGSEKNQARKNAASPKTAEQSKRKRNQKIKSESDSDFEPKDSRANDSPMPKPGRFGKKPKFNFDDEEESN